MQSAKATGRRPLAYIASLVFGIALTVFLGLFLGRVPLVPVICGAMPRTTPAIITTRKHRLPSVMNVCAVPIRFMI